MMQFKQKGFTLLELLVVITLLAVLSVGALVAYEGIGDNAQATAAANNTAGTDRAIRNYRAVSLNYPDQWDGLTTVAGATPAFLAATTQARFANLPLAVSAAANDFRNTLDIALEGVGINGIQLRRVAATTPNVDPNLQHNEGAAPDPVTGAIEIDTDAVTNFSVLPTFGTAVCQINGAAFPVTKLDGTTAVAAADGLRQNIINDHLGGDQCNLVLALGFGHDAAHSTSGTAAAIATAPTYVSKTLNPAVNYARYIALFHAAADLDPDGNGPLLADNNIVIGELFKKPTLLAVVDTEGNVIDEAIAKQNPTN